VRKDGSEFSVSLTLSPLKDEYGELIGISTIARDISSRVRMRADLRRARDQLAVITEGAADGITIQDSTGAVVYANQAAAAMAGFATVEEFMKASPAELAARFAILDEEGNPFPWDQLPGRRALLGETHGEVTLHFATESGSDSWSRVRAEPV